jgi:hypothetical protein
MGDAITGWVVGVGTFAVTCLLVSLIPGDTFLGGPPWAWGLAAVIGVTSAMSAQRQW